jgi:signal peptidase
MITMKGDANESEDPTPYTVSTVRIVLVSAPGLAYGIVWLSNPWVLAVLALGASTLVTWAFWPRKPRDRDGSGSGPGDPLRLPESSGRGRHAALVLLVAPLALAQSGPAPTPTASEQVIAGDYLTLRSIGDPQAMARLTPGEPVQWQVGVAATAPGPGEVRIGLIGSGSAGLGLYASISSCARRWVEGHCPGGADMIQAQGPVDVGGTERPLTAMPVAEERWLMFALWLEAGAAEPGAGESVQLQVHATGSGDDATASPGPASSLARTGTDPFLPLLAAAGSIVLGLALAGTATLRRRRNR